MKQARKPLRERVAERKARQEKKAKIDPARQWGRRIGILGNLLQFAALALLVVEILPLMRGDHAGDLNWARISTFAVLFVFGRVVKFGADISRSKGKRR
ncbi:MAG: hypothetical protein ACE5EM_11905 [Sphingomonadales bacterium]